MNNKSIVVIGIKLLIVFLSGCSLKEPDMKQYLPVIHNAMQASDWTHENINYNPGDRQYRTVSDIIRTKTGTCGNMAYITMEILYNSGIQSELIVVKRKGAAVDHALVHCKGKYYDPTNLFGTEADINNYNINDVFTLDYLRSIIFVQNI